MKRIAAFFRKLFGIKDSTAAPVVAAPVAADVAALQAQLAAASARAEQAQLHALDATRQLQRSVPAPSAYKPNPASNTPDWTIWTDTSPDGYPVFYAIGGDGKPVKDASGNFVCSLLYDGQSFPEPGAASAIAAYKNAVDARNQNLANVVLPDGRGSLPIGAATDEDKLYVYAAALRGVDPYRVYAGPGVLINNAINWAGLRFAGYNASTYPVNGPAAVAVANAAV